MKGILIRTLTMAAGLGLVACSSKRTQEISSQELLTRLVLSPSHVNLPRGLTVPVTLTVDRTPPAGAPATVVISGLPIGVLAAPLMITGTTGTLLLSASTTAPLTPEAGAEVTVTVTNGNSLVSSVLRVSVTAVGFSLRIAPPNFSVPKGSSRAATVHVSRENFSGVITIEVVGLPSGVSVEPLSISGNLGNLVFRAEASAVTGSYPLTVSGTSDSIESSAPLLLSVADPGAVDTSFNPRGQIPGLVTTVLESIDGGTFAQEPIKVALQPDGKILVVGTRQRITAPNPPCAAICNAIAIARYNSDGSLDTAFGGDNGTFDGGVPPPAGVAVLLEANGATNHFLASSLAISDAGILIASNNNGGPDTLIRVTSGGMLDRTFNPDGGIDGGIPGHALRTINPLSIAVLPEEKILVAGQTRTPPTPAKFALAQYNADGTLDMTFGDGGILFAPWGAAVQTAVATDAVVNGDKARVVGRVTMTGESPATRLAVVAFDISDGGMVDPSFNDGNPVLIQLRSTFSSAGQAALDLQSRMVVAANARPSSSSSHADLALVSFQPDGGLDSSFGDGGIARTLFDPARGTANALTAATSADKIVVAGGFTQTGGHLAFLVVRYNSSDGSPDTAFGSEGSGIAINDPNPADSLNNNFQAITFQPDGKMVAVGTVEIGRKRFTVVRYLP